MVEGRIIIKGQACTILLLSGEKIQRVIKQYNGAYYVIYLTHPIPVTRDQVVGGRQTYKQVPRFKDAGDGV